MIVVMVDESPSTPSGYIVCGLCDYILARKKYASFSAINDTVFTQFPDQIFSKLLRSKRRQERSLLHDVVFQMIIACTSKQVRQVYCGTQEMISCSMNVVSIFILALVHDTIHYSSRKGGNQYKNKSLNITQLPSFEWSRWGCSCFLGFFPDLENYN